MSEGSGTLLVYSLASVHCITWSTFLQGWYQNGIQKQEKIFMCQFVRKIYLNNEVQSGEQSGEVDKGLVHPTSAPCF